MAENFLTLIANAGAATIHTLDYHSEHLKFLSPIPLVNHMTASLFAHDIQKRGFSKPLIVAPDQGAKARAICVATLLQTDYLVLTKQRGQSSLIESDQPQPANRICILIDDILDSGETLRNAQNALRFAKTTEAHAYVTHAVGKTTGLSLDSLTITNSLGITSNEHVTILSLEHILINIIQSIKRTPTVQ